MCRNTLNGEFDLRDLQFGGDYEWAALEHGQRRAVLLQTELENRELRLNYSRPERTSLDERY